MPRERLIPLIVAVALFMENMDSTVIATSLPAIAADLGESPIALKLALTSYLLSLAVFIPASGWTADRFGARNVFRLAIVVFSIGSIGCAFSTSLSGLVASRIVQGLGGAMMTPVGRLLLVRSVDKSALVDAMAWFTMPALIGPVVGPPLGGWITTNFGWPWVFLINIPIGIIGVLLVTRYIEDVREPDPGAFDGIGFVLSALGVAGLAFGFSVAGMEVLPVAPILTILAVGAVSTALYIRHAGRTARPILALRLLAVPTFRASFVGGFLFRIGVGAIPFLLPLMLQLGFGLSPLQSGLITFSAAVGAFTMKTVAGRILRVFGFKPVLVVNAVACAFSIAACALFWPSTPYLVIFPVLIFGGFLRSLQFTSLNTIAFADIERKDMSAATSLASVGQQVSLSFGVASAALVLETLLHARGRTVLTVEDFHIGFVAVSLATACSCLVFARLARDAGAALTRNIPDQPVERAETAELS